VGSGSSVSRKNAYRDSVAESLRSALVSVCPFDGKPCSFGERLCEIKTEGASSWFCVRCPDGNITWKGERV
jgi:hypothetical protein